LGGATRFEKADGFHHLYLAGPRAHPLGIFEPAGDDLFIRQAERVLQV
jgi:hypothetical protein